MKHTNQSVSTATDIQDIYHQPILKHMPKEIAYETARYWAIKEVGVEEIDNSNWDKEENNLYPEVTFQFKDGSQLYLSLDTCISM